MNDFINNAKTRFNSETPDFWIKMKPVLGSTFGGLAAIQAALPDEISPWIKWTIVFVTGSLGYLVGNFGTKNTNLLK